MCHVIASFAETNAKNEFYMLKYGQMQRNLKSGWSTLIGHACLGCLVCHVSVSPFFCMKVTYMHEACLQPAHARKEAHACPGMYCLACCPGMLGLWGFSACTRAWPLACALCASCNMLDTKPCMGVNPTPLACDGLSCTGIGRLFCPIAPKKPKQVLPFEVAIMF